MARILIVEDDYALGVMLGAALGGAGHQVKLAASGANGLDVASRERFDVVLADLGMPGMSGAEMIRHMRKGFPGLKIVAMSGSFTPDQANSGLARSLGADALLPKPFQLKGARDTVSQCLAA